MSASSARFAIASSLVLVLEDFRTVPRVGTSHELYLSYKEVDGGELSNGED